MNKKGGSTRDNQRVQPKLQFSKCQGRQVEKDKAHKRASRIQEAYQRERQNKCEQKFAHKYSQN